jgi:hypothetical protein
MFFMMKSLFSVMLSLVVAVVGCGKAVKKVESIELTPISVTCIASGAKTKSGKLVDVYEVTGSNVCAVFLIADGGKLSTSGFHLLLNGNELLVQKKQLVNSVLAVDARIPIPVFLPGVTAADAKAKCSAGGVIDLPGMDEALAKTKSFMPNP